jgi:hypothetical protein
MVPAAFQSAKVLRTLNIAAVGASLAALVAVIFGGMLHMPSLYSGLSTAVVGGAWAWALRIRTTLGRSTMRVGWILSLPLATLNAATAASLTFGLGEHDNVSISNLVAGAVLGATFGALFWVPSLVLTLLLFGVPIAWSQKLAAKGLAGEERGERLVGMVTVVLAVVAFALAQGCLGAGLSHELVPGLLFGRVAAIVACVAGGAALALSHLRELRRRAFVARAEAGEIHGFRVDAHEEGKVLVRVTSNGEGYRVADFQEEIYLLDEEGRATEARELRSVLRR